MEYVAMIGLLFLVTVIVTLLVAVTAHMTVPDTAGSIGDALWKCSMRPPSFMMTSLITLLCAAANRPLTLALSPALLLWPATPCSPKPCMLCLPMATLV